MTTLSGWSLWVHFKGKVKTMMLFQNVASWNVSDSCELWLLRRRRMGALATLWSLANGMNVSMNHAVLISLSVQPLGDVVIAAISPDRSGNEGMGPLERTKEGGTDNPEGDMHSISTK
jgi:hypothetical protein